MAIIRDFYNKNGAHILIDDSCLVKTKEERDQILRNIGRIWYESEMKKLANQIEKEGTDKSV